MGWVLNPVVSICIRRKDTGEERQGDGLVNIEAETEVTQLPAKKGQGLPAAARSQERGPTLIASRRTNPAYTWISDFWPTALLETTFLLY